MEKETFTTKLHEVCSSDELRPITMCVHFKNGYAYASDGVIVIKQTLDLHSILNPECLEDKSIHKDNYKAIMQFDKAVCDDAGVACTNADGRTAFYEYYDRKNVAIPEFDKILFPLGEKSVGFIGIDPDRLHRLSKAMHSPTGGLKLQFQGVDRLILVTASDINDQFGAIMPVIINDTLFK